jgi:hypothetical protein
MGQGGDLVGTIGNHPLQALVPTDSASGGSNKLRGSDKNRGHPTLEHIWATARLTREQP